MSDSPVALITGASTGIGAAAARLLLGKGHRVVAMARRKERLDAFAEDLGRPKELLTYAGDAADWDTVEAAVASTVAEFGRLDAAIANAGFATHDSVGTGDPRGWRDMVLTNVLGPALLIRASLAELKKTRGRIVIVGSVAGFVNTPGNIYGATKWAMTGLAENTRRQVAEDGVGVTLLAPGAVETNFWEGRPPETLAAYPNVLTADQAASAIVWAIEQPSGVDVNTVVMRPIGQAN